MPIDDVVKGRISEVILNFFSSPTGRSLMLRGAPGTGKTTFALELLGALKAEQRVFYMSARVDERSLKNHIPWLDPEVILSTEGYGSSHDDETHGWNRKELDRLETRIELGDAQLENPFDTGNSTGQLEEDTITFEMPTILPEMDRIYNQVGKVQPSKSTVVIDSIDALSEKYGISSTRLVHVMQKDLVENSQANVLFVMERVKPSDQDFLGDGVISLETSIYNSRIIRLMKIEKLRGFPIYSSQIPFTLYDGHFLCFEGLSKYVGLPSSNHGKSDVDDQNSGSYQLNLSEILSNILESGKYNLIEIEPEVPVEVILLLNYTILNQALSGSNRAYAIKSHRLFGNDINMAKWFSECDDKVKNTFRILTPRILANRGNIPPYTNIIEGESFSEDLDLNNIENLYIGEKHPFIFLADINQIISQYGTEGLSDLETHITSLVSYGGTCIGYYWPSVKSVNADFGFSDTLFRISQIGSNTVIYGDKPYTPLHFLSKEMGGSETSLSFQLMI